LLSWLTERNGGGWGLVASPVFKTGVTRPSRAGWVRFPHSPATIFPLPIVLSLAIVASATFARAQGVDSTLAGVGPATLCTAPGHDSTLAPRVPRIVIAGQVPRVLPVCRVPLSPTAALIRSLLVPGLGELELDRRKSAAIFAGAEVGTILMSLKSKSDLNAATAARRDTVGVPLTDANGAPVIDPKTGLQAVAYKPRNQNLADRVRARRTHLEDWIAGILFNHLFSGADAWVAANLADFNANVNVTALGRGVQVAARIAW
jgi:hypothetical protein